MTCPKCNLLNPDSALRCDCGYDFQTRTIQQSYLEMTPKQGKKVWWRTYWPAIVDEKSAASAARNGATSAFWVAGVTGVFATLALLGVFKLVDPTAFLDASLFLIIGLAIRFKYSRIAAVSGLLLYLLEIAARIANPPSEAIRPVGVVTVIFVLYFVSGIRGTFAYRKLREMPPA